MTKLSRDEITWQSNQKQLKFDRWNKKMILI